MLFRSLEGIADVIRKYPRVIWMVDAVSSLGGVRIETDKLGIDVCISSSQKALALPPGLSLASVSERTEERLKKTGRRGFYLDLLTLCEYIDKRNNQYSCTPSLPHMFALDFQLDRIFKEGLENRFIRHIEIAEYMINWANHFFKVYTRPGFESLTVTCIENNRQINIPDLNKELQLRNMVLSNGYGELKDKTFRVGHMGETNIDDMMELTNAIDEILKLN